MIFNLFGFVEVRILPLFLVMTSFIIVELSNLHILWNIIEAISPVSFNFLGCMDLVLQRGGISPSAVPGEKSPVLLGLSTVISSVYKDK